MSGLTAIRVAGNPMLMSDLVVLRAIAAGHGEAGLRPLAAAIEGASLTVQARVARLIDLGLVADGGVRRCGVRRRLGATPQGRAALAEAAAFFAAAAAERRP